MKCSRSGRQRPRPLLAVQGPTGRAAAPRTGRGRQLTAEVVSGLPRWIRPQGAWPQSKSTLPSWVPTPKLGVGHRAVCHTQPHRVPAAVGSGAPKPSTGRRAEAGPLRPGGRTESWGWAALGDGEPRGHLPNGQVGGHAQDPPEPTLATGLGGRGLWGLARLRRRSPPGSPECNGTA